MRACSPVGGGRSAGGGKPRGGISTVDGTSGSATRSDQSRLRPGVACTCSRECWRSRCRAAIALSRACSAAYLASSADSSASSAARTASSSAIAASSAARRASWSCTCSSKSSSSPASSAPPRPPVLQSSSRTPCCKCVGCNCGSGRELGSKTRFCYTDRLLTRLARGPFLTPSKSEKTFACNVNVNCGPPSMVHPHAQQPPLCASLARFRCSPLRFAVFGSSYAPHLVTASAHPWHGARPWTGATEAPRQPR